MSLFKTLHLVVVALLMSACAQNPQKYDQSLEKESMYLTPLNQGKLTEGNGYYLEFVGGKDFIKIYPLRLNRTTSKLEPMELSNFYITALYNFTAKPHRHQVLNGRKANLPIHLVEKDNCFYGELKSFNMKEYQVVFNVVHNDDSEKFEVAFKI